MTNILLVAYVCFILLILPYMCSISDLKKYAVVSFADEHLYERAVLIVAP